MGASNSIYLIQCILLKTCNLKCAEIGMNKRDVPDYFVKAEMGAFPVMRFFIKRIFSFWEHVLASFGKNNLVNETTHAPILMIEMIKHKLYKGEGLTLMFRYDKSNV